MKVNYATISNNANRVKGSNPSNFVGSLQYCPSDPRVVSFIGEAEKFFVKCRDKKKCELAVYAYGTILTT